MPWLKTHQFHNTGDNKAQQLVTKLQPVLPSILLVSLSSQHHSAGSPQIPGQHDGPSPYAPVREGTSPDHDEIIRTIISIEEQNQLVRIMTKTGPIALKVMQDSELLILVDQPEALLEIDLEDF